MLQRMRSALIAALLAATAFAATANASPCAEDFGAEVYGIVESVREVPLRKSPPWLADVFEHAINPETAQELVVRLSDERVIALVQAGSRRFEPGQRVLVVRSADGAHLENV